MKRLIRKLFGWREGMPFSFYLTDFVFRKVLRQNASARWPVHFTSTIHNGERITVGKDTYPGDSPNNYINAANGIEIGSYTNLGPNVSLISANHDAVDNSVSIPAEPIRIGAYSWIGSQVVVLPGVQLGEFTIVGAGAVVTKSFTEGYCVIAGNPARIIKSLDKEKCLAFARENPK